MDDDTLRVEFPLGDTTIVVTEPSDQQLFLLVLTRKPQDGDVADSMKLVKRLFRVFEKIVGEDQWENVIEEGLLEARFTPNQVMQLISDVIRFPWSEHSKAVQTAAEEAAPVPVVEAKRPGPRIVSGG
jgi:hypothetical protein